MRNVMMQRLLYLAVPTGQIAEATDHEWLDAEIDVRESHEWKAEYKAIRRRSSHSVLTMSHNILPLFQKMIPGDVFSRGSLEATI